MRRVVIVAAIVGSALVDAMPSVAEPAYPWCLKADVGAGAMVDLCYFRSFERCAQERFGWGTTSFCIVNPQHYFRAEADERRPGKSKRKTAR